MFMIHRRRIVPTLVLACLVAIGAPGWLDAQVSGDGPPSGPVPPTGLEEIQAFGQNSQYTVFFSTQFNYDPSTTAGLLAGGYVGPFTTTFPFENCSTQLTLPSGASVDYVYAPVYDDDTQGYVAVAMVGHESSPLGGSGGADVVLSSASSGSTETPGFTFLQVTQNFPFVVRTRADLDGDGAANDVAYELRFEYLQQDGVGKIAFWGVVVRWHRTISPAPATATFPDVSKTHWAFQYVEALAASGITLGYADGTFRPTNPVTRAQMATFLARALGLHWPD